MPQQELQISTMFNAELVRLRPALYRQARRLCSNADLAEDLVQDTLLRAMDRKNSFRAGTNLRAWTFTILRNLFYAHWHKQKKLTAWEPWIDDAIIISGGQEEAAALTQMAERMHSLPETQRDALALVAVGGCSYDEAAEIEQCAVGTMKSRVSRARATLMAWTPTTTPASTRSGFDRLMGLCSDLMPRRTVDYSDAPAGS
jgi:RNA polymerase sigma-70 factor (ECF subfamily)